MGMSLGINKLVVRDVPAAEAFYCAMGLKVVSRNVGGEADVRQEQSWLSTSGDMETPVLLLTRFLELPDPPRPVYPGESWLVFRDVDVDAACQTCIANGGSVFRASQNRPEHGVRAAVIADPEGHYIELVGPTSTS